MKPKIILILTIMFIVFVFCEPNDTGDSGDGGDYVFDKIKGDGTYTSPDGKATLEIDGNKRILKLSGSNAEMGYNHGFLLGPEIIDFTERYITAILNLYSLNYNNIYQYSSYFSFDTKYEEEMASMVQGIKDAFQIENVTFTIGTEERTLGINDIKLMTVIPDIRVLFYCSSFIIWGDGRSDDSTLIARNLDYFVDSSNSIKEYQTIISFNPNNGNKWISASFCGYIGCLSGMNENGLCAMIHDTNHYSTTSTIGSYVPRVIALRKVIEETASTDTPSNIANMLDNLPALAGNNYDICFKSNDRTDNEIAGIIEYDGKGDHIDGRATLRSPSDNATLPNSVDYEHSLSYSYAIINTNHYLKRNTAFSSSWSSTLNRYQTIKSNLETAKSDGNVDIIEARYIMSLVGNTSTIQTIILEPNTLKSYIYLSEKGVGAFNCKRYDFDFEDLF